MCNSMFPLFTLQFIHFFISIYLTRKNLMMRLKISFTKVSWPRQQQHITTKSQTYNNYKHKSAYTGSHSRKSLIKASTTWCVLLKHIQSTFNKIYRDQFPQTQILRQKIPSCRSSVPETPFPHFKALWGQIEKLSLVNGSQSESQ